jgi:hypothetical protein
MKPYYEDAAAGIVIYHGDAREFCSGAGLPCESVITDPVWPNSAFPDVSDPQALLGSVLQWADERTKRIVIHLGCNSDPRFLAAVPARYKFFRTCWLEYACPSYIGRLLYTGDVAYAFGEPPASRPGAHVIPGRIIATKNDKGFARGNGRNKTAQNLDRLPHPTPRKPQHVRWLVKYFGGASVFDPFAGSGTVPAACKEIGIPCVAVEREESFCEIAARRLSQEVFDFGAAS